MNCCKYCHNWGNVIKLFTAVSYKFSKQPSVFARDKPFMPRLFFVRKAGAYTIEEPFRCPTLGYPPGLANKQ